MAFRAGTGGHEMWPQCFELGVAAITYYPLGDTDLSRFEHGEPQRLWARLSPSQKYSLRKVAYEMRKGDIIFAKQGAWIVGKGIVKRTYQYDSSGHIVGPNGSAWRHQVPVKWQREFRPLRASLGDQQWWTVRELSKIDVLKLAREGSRHTKVEATEGELVRREVVFRRRNAALIAAKKAASDYRCESCGFSFAQAYGEFAREIVIAHHITPISRKSGSATTTLGDIALLCANCHAVVHSADPILSPSKLKQLIRRSRVKRAPNNSLKLTRRAGP